MFGSAFVSALLYLIGEPNYDFLYGRVAILPIEFQGNHCVVEVVSAQYIWPATSMASFQEVEGVSHIAR
jgi:hypothetical protein